MNRIYSVFGYWAGLLFFVFTLVIFFVLNDFIRDIVIDSKKADLKTDIVSINNLLKDRLKSNPSAIILPDRLREELYRVHSLMPYDHLLVIRLSDSFLYYGDRNSSSNVDVDGLDGFPIDYSHKYQIDELLYDKDIVMSRDKGEGDDLRYYISPRLNANDSVRYLFYAMHFDNYYIRLAFSFSSLDSTISNINSLLFYVFMFLFILFFLSNLYFMRMITLPIVALKGFIDKYKLLKKRDLSFSRIKEISLLQRSVMSVGLELRKQFSELSRRRRQAETVIKHVSEGVLILDGDLKVSITNRGLYRVLDIRKEVYEGGLEGRYYYEIIKDNEIISLIEQSVLENKKLRKRIDSYSLNDRVLDFSVTPLPKGMPGSIIFIDNITESYKESRLRSEFINNVSYELQNSISIIDESVDILSQSMSSNTSNGALKSLDNISSSISLISRFIRDLIVLNKLDEPDKNYFRKELFSAVDVIYSCLNKMSSGARDRGIELISLMDDSEDIELRGNKELLELVFSELIDNALNYTEKGGAIKLSMSLIDNVDIVFLITDTGIGIPMNERDKVFDRFYAVDKRHSRSFGGTGLGLSIVKSAMLSHYGGSVSCYDNPNGKGSEFRLIFPNPDNSLF